MQSVCETTDGLLPKVTDIKNGKSHNTTFEFTKKHK